MGTHHRNSNNEYRNVKSVRAIIHPLLKIRRFPEIQISVVKRSSHESWYINSRT